MRRYNDIRRCCYFETREPALEIQRSDNTEEMGRLTLEEEEEVVNYAHAHTRAPLLFLSRKTEKLGALTDTFVLERNALQKSILPSHQRN